MEPTNRLSAHHARRKDGCLFRSASPRILPAVHSGPGQNRTGARPVFPWPGLQSVAGMSPVKTWNHPSGNRAAGWFQFVRKKAGQKNGIGGESSPEIPDAGPFRRHFLWVNVLPKPYLVFALLYSARAAASPSCMAAIRSESQGWVDRMASSLLDPSALLVKRFQKV